MSNRHDRRREDVLRRRFDPRLLDGSANGHAPHGPVPMIGQGPPKDVPFNPMAVAANIASSIKPGAAFTVGVHKPTGQPIQIQFPDLAPLVEGIRAKLPPTEDAVDQLEVLELLAAFQAASAAVIDRFNARRQAAAEAEAQAGSVQVPTVGPPEPAAGPPADQPAPEAEARPGPHDANGSPVE
jgi:hypothetical protein